MLRAEPESTDNSQENIHQQEAKHTKLCLHLVHVLQLADFAQLLEGSNIEQVEIPYLIKAIGIVHQSVNEIIVFLCGNAEAEVNIAGIAIFFQQVHIENYGGESTTIFVRSVEMRPANRLGNSTNAMAYRSIGIPIRDFTSQQSIGILETQLRIIVRQIGSYHNLLAAYRLHQFVGACSVSRLVAEHTEEVRLYNHQPGVQHGSIYGNENAIAAFVVGIAVLRKGDRFHPGAMLQAVYNLQ